MKALLAFGLLIFVAFLGSRFLFRGKKHYFPFGYFFFSGIIYIFLGLSLGKKGLNVLSPQVLEGLSPLMSLGLGWVGFLFGFHLEYRYLRKFPRRYIGLSFLQTVFVVLLGIAILLFLLRLLFPSESRFLLSGMAVSFGLLLSLNSPSLLNFASSVVSEKGIHYYLARFLASVSGFWGLGGLALVASFWHFPFLRDQFLVRGLIILSASTLFPVLAGYLFHFLTGKKVSEQDLLVYLLGIVFFTSGTATYFNLPPLYICMVLGITFSNLSATQEKIYPLLLSTEKPFYIIFLILIGAFWEFDFHFKIALLVLFLLALRIIGYVLPVRPLGGVLRFPFPLPPRFGLCFLSSGGIAVAFVFSLKLMYSFSLTDNFVSAALLLIVLSELLSPLVLGFSLLKPAGKEQDFSQKRASGAGG